MAAVFNFFRSWIHFAARFSVRKVGSFHSAENVSVPPCTKDFQIPCITFGKPNITNLKVAFSSVKNKPEIYVYRQDQEVFRAFKVAVTQAIFKIYLTSLFKSATSICKTFSGGDAITGALCIKTILLYPPFREVTLSGSCKKRMKMERTTRRTRNSSPRSRCRISSVALCDARASVTAAIDIWRSIFSQLCGVVCSTGIGLRVGPRLRELANRGQRVRRRD